MTLKHLALLGLILALQLILTLTLKVNPTTSLFTDQYNRSLIFHGVNTVYKTYPFYPDT
jgi:hypothetical protein